MKMFILLIGLLSLAGCSLNGTTYHQPDYYQYANTPAYLVPGQIYPVACQRTKKFQVPCSNCNTVWQYQKTCQLNAVDCNKVQRIQVPCANCASY